METVKLVAVLGTGLLAMLLTVVLGCAALGVPLQDSGRTDAPAGHVLAQVERGEGRATRTQGVRDYGVS